MEANRGEVPQFETPKTPSEQSSETLSSAERPLGGPENSPSKQPKALPVVQVPDPAALAMPIPQDDGQAAADPVPTPSVTADSDQIDKQWVDRAKKVINETRDDPFRQKDEMSRVKAEYIQKRFNKSIKVNESTT